MTVSKEDEYSEEDFRGKPGFRHIQVFLLFLIMSFGFSFRSNISMAVVAMTDDNNENYFDWSMQSQSVILSSFTWGYVVSQFPGGELAARFGGKLLLCLCLAVNSLLSFVTPFGANLGGWQLVCACRVVQGFGQGILMPCMHHLIGKWAPLEEKSRIGTFIYSGAQFGIALQMLISGYLVSAFGWPGIFYTNGIMGTALLILYIIFGADSPQTSRWISKKERFYIQTSLGQVGGHKRLPTPWKKMWTSLPFISLIIANCAQNWGLWTLMTLIPSYLSQVQGVSIKSNGLMSAIPYLAIFIFSFPFGYLADLVIRKKWCSLTITRKIFNSIGFFGPGFALIGLSYAPADVTIAVVLLTVVMILNAGHFTGFLLGHIDMAPNFAGTMSGITNGFANVLSIFAPLAAGLILIDETDANDWRKVFYLSSGIYIGCNIFYLIFGSSARQDWNEPNKSAGKIIKKIL
ncbi:hypothetical protein ABMA28_017158 [Loxostege sticticalis]|uniref:Putative inorganic phosphate cotransporter n=1 Tax=Loxostege sticticalis TaxID=481309 RepID=A0ABD0TAZ9_LOXSC